MKGNNSDQLIHPAFVAGIEVEKLFGRYNYNLEIPFVDSGSISKITMLYGDNGTGKTTILKLLFHLMSPEGDRGHRGFIGSIPFARFSVLLSDRTKLEAIRDGSDLVGSYAIKLTEAKKRSLKGEIVPDPDGRVSSRGVSSKARQIIDKIGQFGLSIFLLGDDRILQSDLFEDDSEEYQVYENQYYDEETARGYRRRRVPSTAAGRRDSALRLSLERTATWLRRRSIQASTRGEAEAQQIYANIVEKINRIGVPEAATYEIEKEKLIEQLRRLDERSSLFERFGLIPRINADRFIKGLLDTTEEGIPFVSQVISSFVDGQKVRLNTLEELWNPLNRFLVLINGFLRDKHITIEAREGISIMTDSGAVLDPDNLSSGEKQLLLLFCNVLTSSEMASLFLIDEPEISLNVKWQRKLIDSLIEITSESNCQFLLATHSIELLTKHRNQTIKLNPI